MVRDGLDSDAMKNDRQLVVRLPAELYERLEKHTEGLRTETGFSLPLAEVVRKLLSDALDASESPPRKKSK